MNPPPQSEPALSALAASDPDADPDAVSGPGPQVPEVDPDSVLSAFHPAVSSWFTGQFGTPTPAQARAWQEAAGGGNVLVAAPTGSGKTLAAFLAAIDALVRRGQQAPLPDAVQVLYVSPLKALSNDIEKNLQQPLHGIRDRLLELGQADVPIRSAVRTGDTPAGERALMRRLPPHILVTTPESLHILLTSESGRAMLGDVRTVIVDELHALAGSKRGAHLMLSLERLAALAAGPAANRIGLSATVKPVAGVAGYLVGTGQDCAVVDTGHSRRRDLGLEIPRSPLTDVMATEVWGEVYDRLAELVGEHRTTLIFVNQRRTAERVSRHLAERVGEAHVTAHHGSLSREHRLQAEQLLKAGRLKALVATSSLELGIDIGEVDLVCQLGSPRRIAAFLQRVGRAGHAVDAVSRGRLFPLTLDDLLEGTALLDAIDHGELDRIPDAGAPLDVLAQQIVAEVACGEWCEDALYALVTRATPYRDLARADFDAVVVMLVQGYSTRRGRRGAWLHHDSVQRRLRPRRGARLMALTHAGVIPDQFDSDVVLLPEGHRVGSLDEDFAFDSLPGDIFQLGNTAYRIVKVETGTVFVEDARGQPPTVPFWFGQALGRSDELSAAVARLCADFDAALAAAEPEQTPLAAVQRCPRLARLPVPAAALAQLSHWLALARAALGTLPTLDRVIFERFFDEVGDSHLVIHSPFGSRINKAWGLALRKRFCRQFNFELQASALEDSIVLSLGPTHSFPLAEVAAYLHPATARQVLVQALLDAPMFPTHWRWCASVALAIRRNHGGRRRPPQFQRSDAEDLLTVVFPDQVACAENLSGERQVPEHPLVAQALHDCLHQTMDVDGFLALVSGLTEGRIQVVCRDLAGPSPLAGAVLNARPWAFLDDGDAEARRTRAVGGQGVHDLDQAAALARPDPEALARVREEIQPLVRDADELHDALVVHGFLAGDEWQERYRAQAAALTGPGRAFVVATGATHCLVARERLVQFLAAVPAAQLDRPLPTGLPAPAGVDDPEEPCPDQALLDLLRGRLDLLGPTTARQLGQPLALPPARIQAALLTLEGQGSVMRGHFDPELAVADQVAAGEGPGRAGDNGDDGAGVIGDPDAADGSDSPAHTQWCERRLLARIHRYSRERRHARVRAVPPARFMAALAPWQHLVAADADLRLEGDAGLLAAIGQLEGWLAPAAAWERDLLPRRVRDYRPDMLDRLCASGQVVWWRPPPALAAAPTPATVVGNGRGKGANKGAKNGATNGAGDDAESGNGAGPPTRRGPGPIRSTPIMLLQRSHLAHWQRLAGQERLAGQAGSAGSAGTANGKPSMYAPAEADMGSRAWRVHQALAAGGALFWSDLETESGLLRTELEQALAELVGLGLVVCDSFAGLRALVTPARHSGRRRRQGSVAADAMDHAGRWSLLRPPRPSTAGADAAPALADPDVEHVARVLLRRYGVVFRALLAREQNLPPWRDLHYVYRRLEARGEINGGRFVSGFSGEQFALADAARTLAGEAPGAGLGLVTVSGADPLNLVGVLVPGARVTAVAGNRVAFADGVAVASHVAGKVQVSGDLDPACAWSAQLHLLRAAGLTGAEGPSPGAEPAAG